MPIGGLGLVRRALQDAALRPHGGGRVEIAGIRAIGHVGPVDAAVAARRLQDRRIADRAEDAFADPSRQIRRALRHHRVADRIGLGRRRGHFRELFDRLLIDADQRFAVGAIEDIDQARLAGLGNRLAHLAVVDLIEQHDGLGRSKSHKS